MVHKIEKINVAHEVMGHLIDQILSGEIKAGEKFPSENELAESFGVSRLTIRTALTKLETLGLIETKVGKGSYVKERKFANIMAFPSQILSQFTELYPYVKEFRIEIEQICVAHVIDRASDEELVQFSRLADQMMEAAKANDIERFNQIDYQFHYCLIEMSGNPLYRLVYATIKGLITQVSVLHVNYMINNLENGLVKAALIHCELVDLVIARDKEAAIENVANLLFVSHDIDPTDIHLNK